VRVIEAVELIAADVFSAFEKNRQRITFGGVERYLSQLAGHPHDCECGCGLVSQVTAQRVYQIASAWQREIRAAKVRAMR
jgi:hypothetical protein